MKNSSYNTLWAERIKKANRAIFDRDSQIYSKKRRVAFTKDTALRLKQRYESQIGMPLGPVDRFLDLGCGSGFILLNLASLKVASGVCGVDISLGMLRECKGYAHDLGVDAVLVQSDVDYLPFKKDSFDLIIGHAILHHLPETKVALGEVYKVLKPGGIAIFTEPSKVGSKIIMVFIWFFWLLPFLLRQLTKPAMEKFVEIASFTPESLQERAAQAGFTKVYTKAHAGFISRIFYWIMDPISQRTSSVIYHAIVNKIIDALAVIDKRLLRFIIPKGWFDEVLVFMQK